MMDLKEKAAIIHYHRHRIEEYPGSVGALGYRAPASQIERFEVLATVADLNGSTVLDVGCGKGDLKAYFDQRFHGFDYIGIDLVAEFIAEARSLYGQRPSCYFCVADIATAELPQADYVFASGLLGYRCADPDYYRAMIAKMYRAAGKALAFNMLDAAKFPAHPLLIGHDPSEVVSFCRTLSDDVQCISGYLEDDFTIVMRKIQECTGRGEPLCLPERR